MTRAVAGRLALLVAILLAGFSYIIFAVLEVRIGAQPFPVTVQVRRGGGLFVGAYVAYRGVDVGRVKALRLVPGGVDVVADLDPGTRVPAATAAVVHDLSAVGEQYVDLVPTRGGGPYLHSGSVIPRSATTLPVTIDTLLRNTASFTNSINTADLSQLLATLTTALGGTGPQLHTILQAGETLVSTLQAVQPQTSAVIDQGHTLLQTASATNPDVAEIGTNLASFTAQLKASNSDLQALIAKGTAALPQVQQLLATNTAVLEQLTANGAALSAVTSDDNAAVQALLAALPGTLNAVHSIVRNGSAQAIFDYNDSEPVCTYTPGPQGFPEPTATQSTLTLGRTCTTSAPNLLQRGANQVPGVAK
ncbi:MCE family protein [Acidiferrimicrobium sp. IK]|uniref:MCE family protein n=1 Tax=Acidiferrimicrobium sp. IK TaxID=2871700 RepID=UPI0021CB16FF|nr:MlaD family protein [Acidiferrimicrobium sp. IK]MCU4184181.1 MCE family protein [Acidiferrimicrobium sp. IK]